MASARHKKRILRELASNPAWRFEAGAAWLCPYCGEPAYREPAPDEPPEEARAARALEHLDRCPRWREFEGRVLPLPDLEARAAGLRAREAVRHALMARPSWQLYDVTRRWYCPFCARATTAIVPEGGRVSTPVLREIERHLASCEGHARGRAAEKPLPVLKSTVAFANRTHKMAEQIRRKVETDATWRLRDAEGRWVCPYCRRVQDRIDFSTPLEMVVNAPLEIAKHLVTTCERFRSTPGGAGAEGRGPGDRTGGAGRELGEADAAGQSSVSLEIARLGGAATPDLVRLSGRPPAEVSGEFPVATPPPLPARPAAAPVLGGAAAAAPRSRREEIEQSLSALRTAAPGLADAGDASDVAVSPLPELEGFELRHFFRGARAHPCDFADAIVLDARRVAIAAGTVSGEGAETGLVLPMVRNLFRMHTRKGRAPAEVLSLVNADLFADLDGRTFVSVVCGLLDVRHREYCFARAGAPAPVLFNVSRRPDLEALDSPGIALGVDRGPSFEESVEEVDVRFQPEDLLVHLTPGVIAAEDADARAIGEDRFRGLVRRYGRHEADYLIVKFGQFFEDWTRGAPLGQDACLLAIKVKP